MPKCIMYSCFWKLVKTVGSFIVERDAKPVKVMVLRASEAIAVDITLQVTEGTLNWSSYKDIQAGKKPKGCFLPTAGKSGIVSVHFGNALVALDESY